MIILFKYFANVENCESFRGFSFFILYTHTLASQHAQHACLEVFLFFQVKVSNNLGIYYKKEKKRKEKKRLNFREKKKKNVKGKKILNLRNSFFVIYDPIFKRSYSLLTRVFLNHIKVQFKERNPLIYNIDIDDVLKEGPKRVCENLKSYSIQRGTMVEPTIHVRGGSTHLWYFGST